MDAFAPALRIALVLALLSGSMLAPDPLRELRAQADSDAPLYLQAAIAQFQAGQTQRARDHLAAARALAPERMRREADARKLQGLLHLTAGRQREAMPELLAYLQIKPTAPGAGFLWYLLADYNLRHGDFARAARAYERAATAGSLQAANPTANVAPWPALAPLSCPADELDSAAKHEAFWQAQESNPLEQASAYAELWERPLENHEIALAAFAAGLYRERPADDPDITELRALLLAAVARPGVRERLGANLTQLIVAPEEAVHHERCLQSLESLERRQLTAIDRGALTSGRRRLDRAREFLTRMHYARMSYLRDAGMYRYGVYLLRSGGELQGSARRIRAIRALHALRGAFAVSGVADTNAAADPAMSEERGRAAANANGITLRFQRPRQLRIQEQILHRIAEAYALMGRPADHDTLTAVAYILADAADRNGSAVDTASDSNQELAEFRRQLFKRCGEDLRNREALLILLGAAAAKTQPAPPRQPAFYHAKLVERDREFEEAELLSAFAP